MVSVEEANELYLYFIRKLYPWLIEYGIASDKVFIAPSPEHRGARVEKREGKFCVIINREGSRKNDTF